MPFTTKNGLEYLTLSSFDELGVQHGFFTRIGGVSPSPWGSLNVATSVGDSSENVIENRQRIMRIFNKSYDSIFDTWQVHSDIVKVSETPRPIAEPHQKGDSVVTSNPEVSLMIVFADCVPVIFYDPAKKVIAIAHAGWKGTVKHVVRRTVESMQVTYGCNPRDIRAGIGPSIGADHYEIGEETAAQVRKNFSRSQDQVLIKRDGKLYFDMWQANYILLKQKGLESIEKANICTACDIQKWYSHRAENGKAGRFAAVITIPND